jgi:hypothetical protein
MNTKLGLTIFSTLKVIGHIAVAIFVTGLIAYFSHHPEFVFYTPLVNVVTSFLIKYFSLTPEDIAASNARNEA